MAVGKVGYTFLDRAGETSRVALALAEASAGNIAGMLSNCNPATAGSLGEAIAAVSACTIQKTTITASEIPGSSTLPVAVFAHRELGLLVQYSDNVTGEKYHVTFPGPDLTNIPIGLYDVAEMTAAPLVALKSEMESAVLSPVGNAITVNSARLVGRNR